MVLQVLYIYISICISIYIYISICISVSIRYIYIYLDKRSSKVQLSNVYTGQSQKFILNWKNEYKADDFPQLRYAIKIRILK